MLKNLAGEISERSEWNWWNKLQVNKSSNSWYIRFCIKSWVKGSCKVKLVGMLSLVIYFLDFLGINKKNRKTTSKIAVDL
jgi:hypothetical protein